MSGNPPSIVLLPSSSSSTSPNANIQTITTHPVVRPSMVVHQPSTTPFKSVIVKPYRDSIQQALTTSSTSADIKPIILQRNDNIDLHQPSKRLAFDSSDLNNSTMTFSAVPKCEVMTTLQPMQTSHTLPVATTNTSFSTLRLVTPSSLVHPVQSSGQQIVFQPHGNFVIAQPLVTVQVQQDPNSAQKENNVNTSFFPTDQAAVTSKTTNSDYLPVRYQRKPCNCTKSMCLKLYCDCFANGLNCQNCACLNCHNDSRHEEERTKAVAATLERNPNAFKSKMFKFANATLPQTDRPLKGCNCKKSSCHKRYCECYESKVPCTNLCKCIGCKNTEQSMHSLNVGLYGSGPSKPAAQTSLDQIPRIGPPTETSIPNNVFNMEVTEALASCLLITGQQCEMNQMNELESQQTIFKEFQRCMHQIVQSALGRPPSQTSFD